MKPRRRGSVLSGMTLSLSPLEAWQPLPEGEWSLDDARHLLRRAGWAATPSETKRAVQDGLNGTLDRLFPIQPALLPKPDVIGRLEQAWPEHRRQLAAADPEGKRALNREEREK